MGHQIIRQPDGRLAIFSSVVDSWIITDATADEIADYYAERAAEDARERVGKTLEAVQAGEPQKVYYQFAMSFSEANEASREHGGDWWQDGEWHSGPR